MVGIVLAAGGALGAVVLATSGRDRVPVVSLAADVERGEVLEESDLAVAYIGADRPVEYVDSDELDGLVGQAARVELDVGTIVTDDQVAPASAVSAAGEATVGVSLEPGQVRALSLAPGDRVSVVSGSGSGGGPAAGATARAEVVAIDESDEANEGWWVSLRASEADAITLAAATASGARLQLAVVGE